MTTPQRVQWFLRHDETRIGPFRSKGEAEHYRDHRVPTILTGRASVGWRLVKGVATECR